MGYPMSWRRVVNRNGIADGDYGDGGLKVNANVEHPGIAHNNDGSTREATWEERAPELGEFYRTTLVAQKAAW